MLLLAVQKGQFPFKKGHFFKSFKKLGGHVPPVSLSTPLLTDHQINSIANYILMD